MAVTPWRYISTSRRTNATSACKASSLCCRHPAIIEVLLMWPARQNLDPRRHFSKATSIFRVGEWLQSVKPGVWGGARPDPVCGFAHSVTALIVAVCHTAATLPRLPTNAARLHACTHLESFVDFATTALLAWIFTILKKWTESMEDLHPELDDDDERHDDSRWRANARF